MTIMVGVAEPDNDALLDQLDTFAAEWFPEGMRCQPSAADKLPLYPERWRLPRLADSFHLLYANDSDTGALTGYCVIDPYTGMIRWLVCAQATLTDTTVRFCEEAKTLWELRAHGQIENEYVRKALLENPNIIEDGGQIVYDG
jgi:hypothetical protein